MFVGTLQGIEMLGNRCSIGESHFHAIALNFHQSFFIFVQSLNGCGISTLKVHQWMLLNMNL